MSVRLRTNVIELKLARIYLANKTIRTRLTKASVKNIHLNFQLMDWSSRNTSSLGFVGKAPKVKKANGQL